MASKNAKLSCYPKKNIYLFEHIDTITLQGHIFQSVDHMKWIYVNNTKHIIGMLS